FDGNPTIDVDPYGLSTGTPHPPPPLPRDPNQLVNEGWQETTHPAQAANSNRREFTNPATGDRVAFDQARTGAPGWEGQDHYHVYNPNSTGRSDMYLDSSGNPCARGSNASHILPSR